MQEDTLKKTPLHSYHVQLGAAMVPFGGWEMPVQYEGILSEHDAVRKSVGIFDISHMGTVDIVGLDALAFVQELITNDASRLQDGKALYSPMCLPSGGVVDDVLVYRLEAKRYRFVINASNREKDLQWFRTKATRTHHAEILSLSDALSLVAVQGPNARPLLQDILRVNLAPLEYYCFFYVDWEGQPVMVSRTGYTGEQGYELFLDTPHVGKLWEVLLAQGKRYGVKPVGLGARDTLRMEMGYCLYGHEIDESITPLEAGLAWAVALNKPQFIGKDALLEQKRKGVPRRLVGLKMQDSSIPRSGYTIKTAAGGVGKITSGGFSPSLRMGLGLGLVQKDIAAEGAALNVEIRRVDHPAKTTRIPFYEKKVG